MREPEASGLPARLGSEAELASLLAREIGHVTARHFDDQTISRRSRSEVRQPGQRRFA